jgi:hypothetical protein
LIVAAQPYSWGLTALFVLFMLMDVGIKLTRLPIVDESMVQLGFHPGLLGFWIGVIEAVLLVLYVVPRTSVLGAILFMGIFGGAIAVHLRVGDPVFSHDLFGVYLGVIMWGGLWLRDPALRALFPVRRAAMSARRRNSPRPHTCRHEGDPGSASTMSTGPMPKIAITTGSAMPRGTPS